MAKKENLRFSSRLIHDGSSPDPVTGAHATPIYQTSTFVFPSAEAGGSRFAGEEDGYIYTRLGNPTTRALEEKMAALEKGDAALAFSSGMAAISAVLINLVKSGDHILCSKTLYGCTYGLLQLLNQKFNVEYSLVDMSDREQIEKAVQPNTRVIYVESPTNPTMELADLEMVAEIAGKQDARVVVDNTFMTPYLQRPLELGADIVVHSATKYIGGHGDVVAGIAVGPQDIIDEIRVTTQKDVGGILGPFEAFLLIRGLKTLAVRMDRHCENAQEVAQYLAGHPRVKNVYYPGLPDFPQHDLARKQMDQFGAVLSFEIEGGLEAGKNVMNHVKMARLAVSLGDVDTLIQHPASMTHSIVPREEREKMGITDGLIRLSVGIEDIRDIIEDLEQALSYAG
ncbi:MAG: methionine gamma-lyase [Bacillaceae bacterium]|nr:methionine gamma-lyase [Bacillaceae bacterium]